MQRNSYVWRPLLILFGLALAVFGPFIVSGLSQLRAAQQARGRYDHAVAAAAFKSAAQRLPWRQDLWEQAGREALAAGDAQGAIQALNLAPDLSPTGWLALGDAYRQTGALEPALHAYQVALNAAAGPEAYAGLAQIHRLRGDLEAERAALQNQLLLEPDNAPAQYRLGLLLSLVSTASALPHLELAAQLDAEYGPVFETLRSTFSLAGLSPTATGRLVTLGRGLGLAGEWPLAVQAFEQAVQQDGNSAEAWAWLGEAKQHIGEPARAELDNALALDGTSVVVHGLRGLYWKRTGDYRQALADYAAASAAEPDNPAWFVSLGESYARLGDLVTALTSYQHAVQLAPDESMYWRLLATFCMEYNLQLEDIGLPAAQRSVELSPEDPLALDVLGWSQLATGQPQAAQQTLLKASEGEPGYAPVHLHLGLAYLQTGDRNAAYQQLQLAMELDPQGPTGEQAGDVLKQYFP